MSIARIALRLAVVEALKGRTLVGDNVLDSHIGSLEADADGNVRTDQEHPFVTVYTDAASFENDIDPRSLIQNGATELVIEAGITVAMAETDPETKETVVHAGIPATDAALEFHLDTVMRQVADALSDPDNEWAEIARSLTHRFGKVERLRTSSDRRDIRLAGQQLRITLDLIDDPLRGVALEAGSPLERCFSALGQTGDPVHTAQADLMTSLLGGNDPDWKVLQRRHGLTAAELLALGLGPAVLGEPRETPEFEAASVAIDGVGEREVSE